MRNFLDNLKYKLAAWMQGRYGMDELNSTLYISFLVLWILSLITNNQLFYLIGLIALIYGTFRAFSRNHMKRSQERLKYLDFMEKVKRYPAKVKQRWQQRKTHKFYRCKQCGVTIRVPRGLGKVEITCPKCGYKFTDKT